jgi:PBP1b-binding outer membrane lipoprotein LpoB
MAAALLLAAGCAEQKVQRVESGQQIDLSGKWNDTDSQLLAQASIDDAMSFPWISNYQKAKSRNPVVMAFGVKNRSTEIINTRTFINDLTRAFIRSGRVDVVAEKEQRAELRRTGRPAIRLHRQTFRGREGNGRGLRSDRRD